MVGPHEIGIRGRSSNIDVEFGFAVQRFEQKFEGMARLVEVVPQMHGLSWSQGSSEVGVVLDGGPSTSATVGARWASLATSVALAGIIASTIAGDGVIARSASNSVLEVQRLVHIQSVLCNIKFSEGNLVVLQLG
jgi:hypothetical protein